MYKILYLEDDETCISDINETIKDENSHFRNKLTFIGAHCLEEAHYYLRKEKIDGIIVDLHINHCNTELLSKYSEDPLDLRNYAPTRFFGIGFILYTQSNSDYLSKIPKLIITDSSFDVYSHYYKKILGHKDWRMKAGDFEEDIDFILNWVSSNFKL